MTSLADRKIPKFGANFNLHYENCPKNTGAATVPLLECILEFLLYRFRWIFVIAFILPASIVFDMITVVRNQIVFALKTAPRAHDRKVAFVQRQIRDWNKAGRPKKLCTARSGRLTMCFRYPKYKDYLIGIRTDKLVDILEFNREKGTIRVEPMVTMGQLTRFLVPLGYTLPIVPELDDLTVGGLINGCGIESSGIRYGLFQHTCLSYEIVTASGELVVASKEGRTEHRALFYGIPWSHGTLGFLVAASLRVIPSKKFVRLTYTPCNSLKSMCTQLRETSSRSDIEFVECLQFSRDRACLMTGRFADRVPSNESSWINPIGRWYKPWFFKYVETIQSANKEIVEYIPIRDYYHRHSRSIFWEIQARCFVSNLNWLQCVHSVVSSGPNVVSGIFIKEIIPFGNNPIFRLFLGWASPPKVSLLKMTMPGPVKNIYDRHHVLQDLLVPARDLERIIEFLHNKVEIYPLWLCPFILPSRPGMLRNHMSRPQLYVDVGVYGTCTREDYEPCSTTRAIEELVRDVRGAQLLYADCFQTRAEFWDMFDASLYDWLRAKYECRDAFPSVYEKVCRAARR